MKRTIRTAVNNGRTRLIIFLLGDPQILKGAEGRQDGTSDPDRVFTLGRSNNLNLGEEEREKY